jgi:hypothetical protein
LVKAYQDAYYWVADKCKLCLPFPLDLLYRKTYIYLGKYDCATYWVEWCDGCGMELQGGGESFLLRGRVWRQVMPDGSGHLCVACFENRLGRKLCADDFGNDWLGTHGAVPLATDSRRLKSRKLSTRLAVPVHIGESLKTGAKMNDGTLDKARRIAGLVADLGDAYVALTEEISGGIETAPPIEMFRDMGYAMEAVGKWSGSMLYHAEKDATEQQG